MSTTIVGVGKKVAEHKDKMTQVAGKRGKLLLIENFDELAKQLDTIFSAVCGKSI